MGFKKVLCPLFGLLFALGGGVGGDGGGDGGGGGGGGGANGGTPSVSYRDYHVFQIRAKSAEDLQKIKELRDAFPTDHLWAAPSRDKDGSSVVSAVYDKDAAEKAGAFLRRQLLEHKIVTKDLQGKFDEADAEPPPTRRRRSDCPCCNETMMKDFRRYDEIVAWMKFLVKCVKGDLDYHLRVFTFGDTYEKRELRGIEIGVPIPGGPPKPAIWLHANEHAREWISGATAVYIIDRLVNDPQYKYLVEALHWHIVPIENPDGYEYSRKDRMWRKNRNPLYGQRVNGTCKEADCKEKACVGVDLNRNWDSEWSKHVDGSRDPCDYQIYDGPFAFSEAESRGAAKFIFKNLTNYRAFFSLHSYGQLWLVPFSYTSKHVGDYDDLMKVAMAGVGAIQDVHHTTWRAGISPEILYAVSGSGMDWAKLKGIQYSYTLELRPQDDPGEGLGFVPKKSQILPSGEEVMAGIKTVADIVIRSKKKEPKPAKPTATAESIVKVRAMAPDAENPAAAAAAAAAAGDSER